MPKSKGPRKGKGRNRKYRNLPPKPFGGTVLVSSEFADAAADGDVAAMKMIASFGGVVGTRLAPESSVIRKFRHRQR